MSKGNGRLLELAISPRARLALAKLREQHRVSEGEIADALVEWFAQQDPQVQQEIIESKAAIQQCAELLKIQPFRDGLADFRDGEEPADGPIRRSSASE
ncbi:MAG TPA: hypothetical protein VH518_16855 [Tepidisphaeraceae bacterium]|jgi:hypothetical protein